MARLDITSPHPSARGKCRRELLASMKERYLHPKRLHSFVVMIQYLCPR